MCGSHFSDYRGSFQNYQNIKKQNIYTLFKNDLCNEQLKWQLVKHVLVAKFVSDGICQGEARVLVDAAGPVWLT